MPPLVYLDTETTGLGKCVLVELSFAVVNEFGGERMLETILVKPTQPISIDAMAVHNITEEEVADLPTFREHPDYQRILDTIETGLVIAHNAPFDIGVLEREGIKVGSYIDTQQLAKTLLPDASRHTLQYLRHYLKVNVPKDQGNPHTSAGDVRVLMAVFEKLAQQVAFDHHLESDALVIEQARRISLNLV